MDNIYLQISYENYRGGVNNLQIAKVVSPSPFKGLANVIKTFSSTKMLAQKRALQFIKQISK